MRCARSYGEYRQWVRFRWENLALAQRRGEAIPPIQVYRVCDRHFVIDGHHRVSIAATTGERQIEAYVTQVLAAAPCGPGLDGRSLVP